MSDYNLGPNKLCLVGNWFEERSLKVYSTECQSSPTEGTSSHQRCIEHTVRLEAREQITSNRKDFNNPRDLRNPLDYKPEAFVGAREKLMMERLRAAASVKEEPREPKRYFDTTAGSDYQAPPPDSQLGSSIGARRMRTRDLEPIKTRDKLWLLEQNAAPKHICLATREGIEAESALIAQDIPITLYSAKPEVFPMSDPTQGMNPFGRNCNFSQPIEHYIRGPVKDL